VVGIGPTRGGRISRAIPLRDVIAAGGALKTGQMASTPGSASQSSNWPRAVRQLTGEQRA